MNKEKISEFSVALWRKCHGPHFICPPKGASETMLF